MPESIHLIHTPQRLTREELKKTMRKVWIGEVAEATRDLNGWRGRRGGSAMRGPTTPAQPFPLGRTDNPPTGFLKQRPLWNSWTHKRTAFTRHTHLDAMSLEAGKSSRSLGLEDRALTTLLSRSRFLGLVSYSKLMTLATMTSKVKATVAMWSGERKPQFILPCRSQEDRLFLSHLLASVQTCGPLVWDEQGANPGKLQVIVQVRSTKCRGDTNRNCWKRRVLFYSQAQ